MLDAETSLHQLVDRLQGASVVEIPIVAVATDLAPPRWRTQGSLTVTAANDSMRIEPAHAPSIRVAGAVVVHAEGMARDPRLSLDIAGRNIRCGAVTFRTSGAKLHALAGSEDFMARRVIATPETRAHIVLNT
ncbi:MAG: hypothetical protein WD598_06800 [Acidimicrobiia bacterium]